MQRLIERPAAAVALIIILAAAFRLASGAAIGFGVDEAYTAATTRTFSLSYFDHPPLSFWIAGLARAMFESDHRLILRAPFIAMFAVTTWAMFRLTARHFGAEAGLWAALALNLSAVFTISTGGWVLPDGPLMMTLTVCALFLSRVLFTTSPSRSWATWLAAGLFLGLAGLSKYHAILFAAGVLLFVATTPAVRHWLRRPEPYVAVALAAIVVLPVLIWNARHDWVSLAFQAGRGAPGQGLSPENVLVNVLGQAVWVLPWIWVPLLFALWRALRAGPGDGARWFFACLAIVPIAIFTIVPLWGSRGLPHWQAPGYLFAFPLLGAMMAAARGRGARWPARLMRFAIWAVIVVVPLLASHAATGWVKTVAPALFADKDPTLEALDWTDLEGALQERGYFDRPGLFVVAGHWIDAGKIGHALHGRLPVLVFTRKPKHFAFLHDPAEFVGQDALIIGQADRLRRAPERYRDYFDSLTPLEPVFVTRGGRPEIELRLFFARRLRKPYPLPYGIATFQDPAR